MVNKLCSREMHDLNYGSALEVTHGMLDMLVKVICFDTVLNTKVHF